MDRCPTSKILSVKSKQHGVSDHANQVWNMLWAKTQCEIIRPIQDISNFRFAIGQQLIDRWGIAGCSHFLHKNTSTSPTLQSSSLHEHHNRDPTSVFWNPLSVR